MCSSCSPNTIPRPHFECPEPTVGHFQFFVFPEHNSQATFSVPGSNCRPLCALRVPRTPFPGHIVTVHCQLEVILCSSRSQNIIPRPHFDCPEQTVGHCVLFVFPEHESQAAFSMSGANCRPLSVFRAPNAQLPDHIFNVQSELYATSWCDSVRNIGPAVQRISKPTSRHAVLPGAAEGSLYSGCQVTTGVAVATVPIVGPGGVFAGQEGEDNARFGPALAPHWLYMYRTVVI